MKVEVTVLGPPVPNKPDSFCGLKAKVEVTVLGFPDLISLIVFVDLKRKSR